MTSTRVKKVCKICLKVYEHFCNRSFDLIVYSRGLALVSLFEIICLKHAHSFPAQCSFSLLSSCPDIFFSSAWFTSVRTRTSSHWSSRWRQRDRPSLLPSQIGVKKLHQPKRVSHHRARVTTGRRRRRRRRFRLLPKLSRADLTLSVLYCQPEKRKSGRIHD